MKNEVRYHHLKVLENEEHDDADTGTKKVSLYALDADDITKKRVTGELVDDTFCLHTVSKQDPLSAYKITDIDDVGYYGFMTADGAWYIMSSVSGYRYFKGDSDYATNWGNRASLSYLYYNQIF